MHRGGKSTDLLTSYQTETLCGNYKLLWFIPLSVSSSIHWRIVGHSSVPSHSSRDIWKVCESHRQATFVKDAMEANTEYADCYLGLHYITC